MPGVLTFIPKDIDLSMENLKEILTRNVPHSVSPSSGRRAVSQGVFPPNFVPTQFVDARGGIVDHGILKLDGPDPQLRVTASSEKHVSPSWVGIRLAGPPVVILRFS